MYITATGLVLRETMYKESSKILTVLTDAEGKITVSAKGARRKNSKTAASTQFLACSEFTLFESRGRWTLHEARSVELFAGLRDDIELLSLGSYFAELLETLADEDSPDPEMLSLGLNALYALSEDKKDRRIIKAAFELRLMCIAGYEPILDECHFCGKAEIENPRMSLAGGSVYCKNCPADEEGEVTALLPGTLMAMRHIVNADSKRIYSFKASDEVLKNLADVCERYVEVQLDKNFKTLDFYKSIKI